jgi:hypothetical protein
MSTYSDLLDYYANLLIAQFNGKPLAATTIKQLVSGILASDGAGSTLPLDVLNGFNLNATVQTLSFSSVPVSGSFTVGYGAATSVSIPFSANVGVVQAAFNGLVGINAAILSGTPVSQSLVATFQTIPVPQTLYIASNDLLNGSGSAVSISVSTNIAVGQQLDWIGKYVGVSRSGVGANGQSIDLSDADFLLFIKIAIATNNFGSSLYTIQTFLAEFFPNAIFVFDYANTAPMQMSFLIDTDAASSDLIQLILAQNKLPVPMGVEYSVVGATVITNFFAWSDYFVASGAQPANTTPINNIGGYDLGHTNTAYRWMDYSYSL